MAAHYFTGDAFTPASGFDGAAVFGRTSAGDWRPLQVDASGIQRVTQEAPATGWQYAAGASGIVNTTTAVTVKAAAGAGVRNYITSLQLAADALGAATEFAIRDGAAGTVIFRTKIQTAGLAGVMYTFDSPLRGTANTLLEIVTLTASVTGGVFANLQGFTGP